MSTDTRLVGTTAENIFLCLLNERGIFSHAFDTQAFDGIIFDLDNEYFKVGEPPFFVQIKCRGSRTKKPNSQGLSPSIFEKVIKKAKELKIPKNSLYLIVGFYIDNDLRKINYYIIPFKELSNFKHGSNQYRFSLKKCEKIMENNHNILKI